MRPSRWLATWLLLALLLLHGTALAADRYVIDQTFGEIDFSVRHLGLFSSHGGFRRWDGTLTIDQAMPERSAVGVTIDTRSIYMPTDDATGLLRSPPYFDVARYPEVRFTSTDVRQLHTDHYAIRGMLTLRGITQPQDFDAVLVDRRTDPASHAETAGFHVSGTLRRSAFGMTEDTVLISDLVGIVIQVRLRLGEALRAH